MTREQIAVAIGFNLKTITISPLTVSTVTPLQFNSIAEAKAYFKPLFAPQPAISYVKVNQDSAFGGVNYKALPVNPPSGTVTLTEITLISGHSVTFSWSTDQGVNLLMGDISTTGFSSNLAGATLGQTWTQSGASATNYPNSSLIYFTVYGTQFYNFFVNGIGNVIAQPVRLSGVYNTNTGQYTMNAQEVPN